MAEPAFTDAELRELAGFVCERYDMMMGVVNDPNPRLADNYRDGCAGVVRQLEGLNLKLRPYYRGGG